MTPGTIRLELTKPEVLFVEKILRGDTTVVTDEEERAREVLTQKIPVAAEPGGVEVLPEEVLYIKSVVQAHHSFVVKPEKFARLALVDRLDAALGRPPGPRTPTPPRRASRRPPPPDRLTPRDQAPASRSGVPGPSPKPRTR